jgi:glycerophosphoryl diester phosphodiesterase
MKRLPFLIFKNTIWLALFLWSILLSCNKQESYPEVEIYGHAGMGMDIGLSVYHDNSIESIALALSLPTIDGVEVDVRMSASSSLVECRISTTQ